MLRQLVSFFPVERACIKLDVSFQVLVMLLMQMCLGFFGIHILITLRVRAELVNDQNGKAGGKFYSL